MSNVESLGDNIEYNSHFIGGSESMYPLWGIVIGWLIYIIIALFLILLIVACFSGSKGDSSGKDDGSGYGSNGGFD